MEPRKCIICGSEFTPVVYNQIKCAQCKNKMIRSCERCGAQIIVDCRSSTKYCASCIQAAKKENLAKQTRVCPVCHREFTPTAAAQKKCADCRGKVEKVCTICGKTYPARLCGGSKYCPDCRGKASGKSRVGSFRDSSASRIQKRKEYAQSHKDQMREISALGTKMAQQSPFSGPFETHLRAKSWVLCDPVGNLHNVTNLRLFIRQHPNDFPNQVSACTMFSRQGRCIRDHKPMTPKTCCGGWYVVDAPLVPEATKNHLDEIEDRKQRRREFLATKKKNT